MALKAQKHSRQTLTALKDVMNPRDTTFVKQQNNAVNQQVNNCAGSEVSETSEKKSRNELLTEVEHETLDPRGTFETVPVDPSMETMGEVDGTEDN